MKTVKSEAIVANKSEVTVLRNRLDNKWRLAVIIGLFTAFALLICYNLVRYQIIDEGNYKQMAADQYMVETAVNADRGKIYDRNMNVIATSVTVERVFISPIDIKDDREARDICEKLSEILDVDYDKIYEKSQKKKRRDETVKNLVEKETTDKIRQFIKDYSEERGYTINSIHFAETTKRYYPYGSLASQVIGFTGTDGDGLLGLELQYNDYLKGKSGKIITSKNGKGENMPLEYESYVDAENGSDLYTTLDMTVQGILEKYLQQTYEDNKAGNRVCGAVMDVKTGGVLAMGIYPNFDLNDPYTLDERSLAELQTLIDEGAEDEDVSKKRTELLYKMWANKVVSDLYEPGSTFKVMTASMALEDDVVTRNTGFYCGGSKIVAGQKINCHKVGGHGSLTFEKGLQMSCNPVFMETAAKIGIKRFCYYFAGYGYKNKTGIDLPGEASPLYIDESKMHEVELAVYSFGQTFKVTPIQQLRALSAVANGGYLVKPHVVSKVSDTNGKELYTADTSSVRQIISEKTTSLLAEIMEGGVIDGAAKNAYVSGYRIAAKTGTSQKQDKYDENGNRPYRIGSTIAFGPLEDPQIAILVMVDEPSNGDVYGSVVAAPYLSKALSEIFPYMGIEPNYSDDEKMISIRNYTGLTVDEAKSKIDSKLNVIVKGSSDKVISQIPHNSSKLYPGGTVILYTEGADADSDMVTVPNLLNRTASDVNVLLTNAGLNLNVEGSYLEGSAVVISQSVPYGTKVSKGTIITVEFRYKDVRDG